MTVAAIPLGNSMLTPEPTTGAVLAGIAFHQWADLSWAVFFFVILRRWTAGLSAGALAMLAAPWALMTSATEWLLLVPVFPFAQPVFTLQQPYWIGFMVHLSSAAAYPLFPAIRARLAARKPWPPLARRWLMGAAVLIAALGTLEVLARHGREIPWFDTASRSEPDRSFIRHMYAHHQQGIRLALLAATRADSIELRQLASLMAASQAGENVVFERWWKSWYGLSVETCGDAELNAMPGYLDESRVHAVEAAAGETFDKLFVAAITAHHKGAVRMADDEWQNGRDPRLRIMAHAIRHEQQGEIALLDGASGFRAVRFALRAMSADVVN